jgi:hypothetical protein
VPLGAYTRTWLDALARAEALDAAGRTVPERQLHPGTEEFLEDHRFQIAQLKR